MYGKKVNQDGGGDFQEAVGSHGLPQGGHHVAPQHDVLLHGGVPQIQVAVLQPLGLVGLPAAVDLEGQLVVLAATQNLVNGHEGYQRLLDASSAVLLRKHDLIEAQVAQTLHPTQGILVLLVSTYLVLTFAELLLSPIGISFVSKVAPPKYKGMMMGAWFVSTALGNFLVQIPGYLWGMDLTIVWGVLAAICVVAALFIFSIIKKLNKVS